VGVELWRGRRDLRRRGARGSICTRSGLTWVQPGPRSGGGHTGLCGLRRAAAALEVWRWFPDGVEAVPTCLVCRQPSPVLSFPGGVQRRRGTPPHLPVHRHVGVRLQGSGRNPCRHVRHRCVAPAGVAIPPRRAEAALGVFTCIQMNTQKLEQFLLYICIIWLRPTLADQPNMPG
jgi:hypothetical protein